MVVELALLAAATGIFISAFNYADARRMPEGGRSSTASAAAMSSASAANPAPQSTAVRPAEPEQLRDWKLVLVNFDHKLPDDYRHTIVHELGVDIDSRVVEPYKEMRDAAQKDNIRLWISSAYRSPERQEVLFNQEIQNYQKTGLDYVEALAKAKTSVAQAGYSEHNSGLALDLNGVLENFGGTPASNWLQKHAQDYGFILRYPQDKQSVTKIKYEPWHYRYVGIENAKKMKQLNLCLEEYIDYLRKNPASGN